MTPPQEEADTLAGVWTIEYIKSRPVIDDSPAYIEFREPGRVGGNASCNRFTGSYQKAGTQLTFGKIATTRKTCAPALMEQEYRLLSALEQVSGFHFSNGLLLLVDSDGNIEFRASPRNNPA